MHKRKISESLDSHTTYYLYTFTSSKAHIPLFKDQSGQIEMLAAREDLRRYDSASAQAGFSAKEQWNAVRSIRFSDVPIICLPSNSGNRVRYDYSAREAEGFQHTTDDAGARRCHKRAYTHARTDGPHTRYQSWRGGSMNSIVVLTRLVMADMIHIG